DWSSDVCASDLGRRPVVLRSSLRRGPPRARPPGLGAGPGAVEPNAAELECRGDYAVPERPEVRHEAQLDPARRVKLEEIAELDALERLHRLASDPVAADLRMRHESLLR